MKVWLFTNYLWIYLKGRIIKKERERHRDLPSTGSWSQYPKLSHFEARSFFQVSHMSAGAEEAFPGCKQRVESGAAGTHTGAHVRC